MLTRKNVKTAYLYIMYIYFLIFSSLQSPIFFVQLSIDYLYIKRIILISPNLFIFFISFSLFCFIPLAASLDIYYAQYICLFAYKSGSTPCYYFSNISSLSCCCYYLNRFYNLFSISEITYVLAIFNCHIAVFNDKVETQLGEGLAEGVCGLRFQINSHHKW